MWIRAHDILIWLIDKMAEVDKYDKHLCVLFMHMWSSAVCLEMEVKLTPFEIDCIHIAGEVTLEQES